MTSDIHEFIVESLTNLVIQVFDEDCRIMYVSNAEKMAGLGHDVIKMRGQTIEEAYSLELSAMYKPLWELAIKGYSNTLRTEHDDVTWLQKFMPVYDSKGIVVGGMAISEDVTLSQNIENESKKREAMIMQMSWVASHNFRRPVASLKGIMALLNEEIDKHDCGENEDIKLLVEKSKIVLNVLDDIIFKINDIAENVWGE